MDSASLSAAVAVISRLVDWKEVAKKIVGDAALDATKAGRRGLLRRLQSDDRTKAAKQAVALFTEEFLKELDDKSPLSAAGPGYRDQLKRLIEAAAPDVASWFEPEIKTVDLAAVARIWLGINPDPLPEDFDWPLVAQNYARAIREYLKRDQEMGRQLALALQEDSSSFEQRFAPGFDLTGYRDFLQKKCGILQLSAMHSSAYHRRMTLWSVFVPQSARESEPVREIPRKLLSDLRRDGYVTREPDEEELARFRERYQNTPVSSVLDILTRHRRVVLLGDPGSGKTSFLKYLVLRWATEGRGPLPLLIELKEFARQTLGLKSYLESGWAAFGLDARRIDEQLRIGEAALYLDGLDEIFDLPVRAAVIEQIAAFSARYPRASLVVTSRIIGYEAERLRNTGFAHATLEEFDDAQVATFLGRWHAVAEDEPKERVRFQERLERAVAESRAIRELAGNPLLLTMMALLNRNQELPRDRVELYREAGRVLLHEWDASKAFPVDTFARQEKEALLRELAGAMQQTGVSLAGNLIERERLIDIIRRFLIALGIQDSYAKAKSLVQQLTERNFILCYAGADRFAFVHRTFLEYFCAAWFVERFQRQRTLSLEELKYDVFGHHWHDEKWHEVLRLITGMVGEKQAGELIEYLMEIDGRPQKLVNLMLAAGCLSEVRHRQAIQDTDRAVRSRMNTAVHYDPPYYYEDWEERNEVGPTRTKAVGLIASVWRSRETLTWLSSMAQSSQDWIIRSAALRELARGWKDDFDIGRLLKDLACSDKSTDVRVAAVEELARGWKDDPHTLALLIDRTCIDRIYFVRRAALRMLARGWKSPETLLLLKDRASSDERWEVRTAAVQELAHGWKDHPGTVPFLKDRANSDEIGSVRGAVLQELVRGWKDQPDTLPWLVNRARCDERWEVRTAAVQELAHGWKDHPGTLPLLQSCARSDPDNDVGRAAVEELARGWRDDPGTLPLLFDLVRSDEHYALRTTAVRELARGWRDDPNTLRLLLDLVHSDASVPVRTTAVQELARGWKDDSDTLPLLHVSARADSDRDVRIAAVQAVALGWKDEPSTLPLLKDRARFDENSEVRTAAFKELSHDWKDDTDTLRWLKECARLEENSDVRMAALRALARGWRHDPDTLSLLKDCVRFDEVSTVGWAAFRELVRGWKDDPEVKEMQSPTQEPPAT